MNGVFTLVDSSGILDREDHPTLHDALTRAHDSVWGGVPWKVFGPNGQPAASRHQHREVHP